ncbi:MAG: serine/threonine protein kinase, partial [Planctomycetes bacterium]|nr:serine/threonine protein kinase [Planctomycetota bacterium]
MQVGPYEVLESLARGAQGAVYQARDSRTGTIVALKHLHARDPRTRRRFETEVATLSRLEHPNLVRVYEWGEDSRGPWVSQELIEGKSLQRRLRRWGSLEVGEAVRIVTALARGLEHAHQAGVLHRDVKPDNVILRPDGAPVLVDFGVARDLQSDENRLSRSGEFLGSPGFWAPEQATGNLQKIGPATDVYGLGATLYALLCGHPPIEASTLVEFLDPSRFGEITPLPEVNYDVSPALWAVCARCLEVDPAQRFPSAAALADALDALQRSKGTSAQRRGLGLALGLAGLVLLGSFAVAAWSSRKGGG